MLHRTPTLATLMLLFVAACDSGTDPLPVEIRPASIEIVAPDLTPPAGSTVELSAIVLNEAGEPIPDVDVTWISRSESVATVSDDGVFSAHYPGGVTIEARAPGVTDDVHFEVGMPEVEPGTATLYVKGTSTRWMRTWPGDVQLDDLFHPSSLEGHGDVTSLVVGSDPAGSRDTIFVIFRDGYLYTDSWGLGPVLTTEDAFAPAAYLLISEDGEIVELWGTQTEGELDLTAEMPPQPSLQPTVARGLLDARLRRIEIDDQGLGSYTGDTREVMLAFDLPYYRVPVAYVTLGLSGAPLTGGADFATGSAYSDGADGLIVDLLANMDADPELFDARIVMRIDTIPHAFNIGSNRTFDAITPEQYANPSAWPDAFLALEYREHDDLAVAAAGQEMGLSTFVPATVTDYGRLDALMSRNLTHYTPAGSASGIVDMSLRFHVPVLPGSPNPRLTSGAGRDFRPRRINRPDVTLPELRTQTP